MARDGCVAAARLCARAFYICIALALGVLLISSTAPSSARVRPTPVRGAPSSLPVQGVYEYCAPATSPDGCVGRLRQIAAGGFQVVLNYAAFDASRGQVQRYMSAAARLGVKLIWPMKEEPWWGPESLAGAYPALAASCRCSGDDAFVRYVVDLVKRSAATWGYYVADEQARATPRR
jgi:hypothetical protein